MSDRSRGGEEVYKPLCDLRTKVGLAIRHRADDPEDLFTTGVLDHVAVGDNCMAVLLVTQFLAKPGLGLSLGQCGSGGLAAVAMPVNALTTGFCWTKSSGMSTPSVVQAIWSLA